MILVPRSSNVKGEVQFVKAEIKRNNITLPDKVINTAGNETSVNKLNKNINANAAKLAKGEKKSEVYVVNNGLLLLHPKKVITSSGVKKSTEPVPPPSVNYHVIRKLKNNGTGGETEPKLLESHLKKRSLASHPRKRFNSKRKNFETGDKRLGIPNINHGRIISVNKISRQGKKNRQILAFSKHNRNRSLKEGPLGSDDVMDNDISSDLIHGSSGFIKRQNEKRTEVEDPLFDNQQEESLQLVRSRKVDGTRQASKRTKKSTKKGITPIKKIPNIQKYFEKPLQLHEYPRFEIKPFPGREYPRFPISPSALLVYPRFALSPQEVQLLHRFPIHPADLAFYPRYPHVTPVAELPRFEKGLKRFTEYPRFEEIKPINLEEFPRYPEPKPIPEIKEIGEADKRSKSKRGRIPKRDESKRTGLPSIYRSSYDDYDDEGNGDDDNDDDDDDYDYAREMRSYMGQRNPFIEPIGSISHIESPPAIPEIADIPFLPEIPSIHGIHGIKPISSIKPIPNSEKTGSSRTMPAEAKNIARVQSNNVSIKDLSKDKNTS